MVISLHWPSLLAIVALGACDKHVDDRGSSEVDFSDPKRVLSSVFYAAQSGESQHLSKLCDPQGESNRHARRVCSQLATSENWQDFVGQFSQGKLIGEARISGDRAQVNFVFGKSGTRRETMELVRRGERWYLLAF